MPGYDLELDDIKEDGNGGKSNRKPGCYVSNQMGFVLVLLAILIAVGIGVVIFFVKDKDLVCNVSSDDGLSSLPDAEANAVKFCKDWMEGAGNAGDEICEVCPAPTTPPTHSSSPTDNLTTTMAMTTTIAMTTSTAAPKYPRDTYRLPEQFRPLQYTIRMQPHIYGNDSSTFFFEGSCTIIVECTAATDTITLHMDRLDINNDNISVKQVNSPKELFLSSSYEPQRQFLMLQLSETLEKDKTYVLEFQNFTGPLTRDGSGFYLSYYRDGDQTVYLATSQMEPYYARKTFPCFDEPDLKATFDITLVRRNDTGRNYITLANTPLKETVYRRDSMGYSWAEDHFDTTPIMPTYVLAFIVCDFLYVENITTSEPNIPYRTYTRPNAIQWTDKAQEYGLKLYHWMDTHFEPPYGDHMGKIDHVAVPDLNILTKESLGLNVYKEIILYHPGVTSASDEFQIARLIAFGTAQMWFGDYVTPKWWNWLWLNRALAYWWTVYVREQVFPNWKVVDEWISSALYSVLEFDALATSHPMTPDVMTPAEILAIFGDVTHRKGGAILRMTQFIMGFDNFLEGLNQYLGENLLGNVENSHLWKALDQVMKVEENVIGYITEKMDPWVTQMGYPVVKVTRTAEGFVLTQERFLLDSVEDTDERYKNATYGYQWEIPIVYATSDNTNMNKTREDIRWLSKNRQLTIPDSTANDPKSWILININQIGYFRVLYDSDTWQALIDQLNRDHTVFSAINRGQIINDAWSLERAGMLDMSVALATLDFLQSETELVPWRAFALEMDYVGKMLERTDLYPGFKSFMQETVSGPLNTLTLDIPDDMVPIDVFPRILIAEYACSYGVSRCVYEAKRLFTEWKNTGVNGIKPDLRHQFYCTAVAEGDSSDWEYVYKQYKVNDDNAELNNLRHALSCSRDQVLLRRLLNMDLDPDEVRTQDVDTTIKWVAKNPLGRDIAFQFFVENFEDLKRRLYSAHLGRVLISVTSYFNTDYNLQQIHQLTRVRDTTVIQSAVDQAMAQTHSNIVWLKDNYNTVKDWLSNRGADTPAPPAAGSYRLPTNLVPYHYDLRLKPYIYGNESADFFFEGSVTIHFNCRNDTRVIVLHQDRLEINPSTISVMETGSSSVAVQVTEVTEEKMFHFYKVHLATELKEGKNYSINFPYFRGELRTNGQGFFLSSYKADNGQTVYLVSTQMEPTYTRQVFPCFDEPALKATFTITLVRRTDTDRDYITLSNMDIVSSSVSTESPAWTEDLFDKTMVMPTYLLAFIVCDFKYLSNITSVGNVDSRIYARPNRIDDADTAHEHALELFDWFNSRFKTPYEADLTKVYHITIPGYVYGAMENWGLIIYRERLLYNSMSTVDARSWIANIISHELAHMWFGNKVSPKWWDWLWLNEAFASYWGYYAVEQLHPNWKNMEVALASRELYAMQTDSYSSSHPLTNPVETPAEIFDQFDIIAYYKGQAIIKMMHMMMGEHFVPALNVYLMDNSLGNADHKDLFDALDKYIRNNDSIDVNMTDIMEPWVTQMGYPVVNVKRVGSRLELTQQRFLMGTAPTSDIGKYGYKYDVPITFTTSAEQVFHKPMTAIQFFKRDQSLLNINLPTEDVDWVVVNLRHEGYFRVNYEEENWNALISQLNTDHLSIHEINRATIIDDAWNLVKAEMLDMSIALRTLDYMTNEMDYGPWSVFTRVTDYMELRIERTELFAAFQSFMQDVVDKPLKTLGFDLPENDDPPIDTFLREWVIRDACKYDHVTCVTKATVMVVHWMLGLPNTINVNLRSHFYCTAIREGSHDLWDFIYQKYQDEADYTEKSRLRNALGCSKDPTILMTFLDMCLYDDEVPMSETQSCINSVAGNRYGRDVALDFVMENFPTLLSSFSSNTLGSIVSTVTQHFQSNYHLSQLQFLMDTYDVSGITNTLGMVKQRTLTNMKWIDKNFHTIKLWLDEKVSVPTDETDYRLPMSIKPYHYDLELLPDIYHEDPADFKFSGNISIWIECEEPTDVITLHWYGHNLEDIQSSAKLMFENETDTGLVTEVTYDALYHFLHVHLREELVKEDKFVLSMAFSYPMPDSGVGLYYSSYQDGSQTVYLATTNFKAVYAREAFPCFDEPALKATFDVTLVRMKSYNGRNYTSRSNNEWLSSTDRGDDYVADTFRQTPVSSTYLLAFMVSDFECLENVTKHNVTYRTCARPNAYQHGQLAQDFGIKGFEWLEDHFEPSYIMSKLDNVAIPDFVPGATENWGLITYRETLLYEEGITTAATKDRIFEDIVHKLSQMWFGNIVSPKWWNWLWLNEAFASFWGFHLVEIIEPTWRKTDQFIAQSQYNTMALDSILFSHPLTADVENQSIYDMITYNKGASIVRMMNFIMGQDNFIAALNIYLTNHQYDVAEHQDLWDALDEYSQNNNMDLNMTDLMDPWVTQMNYPVVTVHWTQAGEFNVTQRRFLSSYRPADDNAPYGYKWDIPVTFATSLKKDFNVSRHDIMWFRKEDGQKNITDGSIPAPSNMSWVLVNVQQYGYYRVNYDKRNWMALINQLNKDHSVFSAINRGQIINDAWSLAKAGMLDMSVALATLDFLQSETELVPWRAFALEMEYVGKMLERTDLYPGFKSFMQDTMSRPLNTLTLDIPEDMVPIDVFLRTLIAEYACSYGVSRCVYEAKRLFTEWKNTRVNGINPNLRHQFYCTAVAEGDSSDWEYVYKHYKGNDDTAELNNLRHALSCSKDQFRLRRLLNMALDPDEVRTQDAATTIQWVAKNPLGRDLAFHFFIENFVDLKRLLDVAVLGRVVISVTSHFNTDYNLYQSHELTRVEGAKVIRPAVDQAVAQLHSNMDFLNDNYNTIKDWLSDRGPDIPRPPAAGSYRLPTNLVPYHYDLRLKPYIYGNESSDFFFEGSVTIHFNCRNDTRVIVLHQDRLEINSSTISVMETGSPSGAVQVTEVTEEKMFHFYKVHLATELKEGKNYSINFPYFRGELRRTGEGLYLSSYKADNGHTVYLATTQMQPTFTRQAFPCFDEPALKATFTTTLVRRTGTDRDYITLSNMDIVSSNVSTGSPAWTEDLFDKTMVMPTYLLAFIVCDFKYLSNITSVGNVDSRTYARPNRIDDAQTAHGHSVELFDWYNSHFKPPYEDYLTKVYHIAIPDFIFGAMENWGLITYREILLYNSMSTASVRAWLVHVTSHELSHMWFGNKVTLKWWDWVWLNEAFASYWQYYAVEQLHPNWKIMEVALTSGIFYTMQWDSYSSSHPLTNPVETPAEIYGQFDIIAYTKGEAIIKMMHMMMGEHFIPALNVYLMDNLMGNVDQKDLFDALDKYISSNDSINLNMTNIMEPWVMQMGYPVVNVKRVGSRLELTQQRFLMGTAPSFDTGKYGYKFDVPITFTTSAEKIFHKPHTAIRFLKRDESLLNINLPTEDIDWVVVNLLHEGYFRVNYEEENWNALISQLNTDHLAIHKINIAAIIDDAWNLVKNEMLDISIALRTLDYMANEMDYGPWRVFARETDYMELRVERTELFAAFQSFMQDVVGKHLKTLGFDLPENDDPPVDTFLRVWVIGDACKYDDVTCVTKATTMVADWMAGLPNTINVNLHSHIYCTAVREGSHDVWDFIYHRYQDEADYTEKSRLRNALGCSKDPTILMTFLDMCLYDDEVPMPETQSCINSVAGNRYGRDVALDFVMENFPTLLSSFSSNTLGSIVSTVTQHFQSNYHLSQLQFLMDTYDVSGIRNTLGMVKQRTLTNMKWIDKNFHTIKLWLDEKVSFPTDEVDYRLPMSIKPYHYDLELLPDIYHEDPADFKFSGNVSIWIKCEEPTDVITLHWYGHNLEDIQSSAKLMFENETDTGLVTEVTHDAPRHFLHVHLREKLAKEENFVLSMTFSSPMPDNGVGLYYSSYQDGNETVYLATTSFKAVYARRAFPCFDEPTLKATFDVTLVRMKSYNGRNYTSRSNNEWLSTTDRGDGYVADTFRQTPVSSTYLLAFMVSDFECLENVTKHNVTYRTCARPNAYQHGQLAQDYGIKELEWLEDHFEPSYIMSKLDNVAIPDFVPGATENWGLITYRETLLYEEGVTTAATKDRIFEDIVHKLSQMWFGNIVSPKWWNWLWLNEAFASFWGFHLVEMIEPTWRTTDQFIVQSQYNTMALDSLVSSHPLTAGVESPSEIQSLFDSITYNKGASIVRMMNFIMGQDNFIAALNIYLTNHQYDVAQHQDLWDALDEYSQNNSMGLNMTDLMDPWVTQINYPVVMVHWTQAGEFTVTQRRFLSSDGPADDNAPYGYKWDIPVTFATSLNKDFNVSRHDIMWFRKADGQKKIIDGSIPAPSNMSWLLVNVEQYGYYRVNYDKQNWMALINQLNKDHSVIDPINRAQIINDAWSLSKTGDLDMGIALHTFDFLQNDDDYVPWRAMARELSYLDLMLSRSSIYGRFEDFMVKLVNDTFFRLGMSNGPNETPKDVFQRQQIVSYACQYGVQECRDTALKQFSEWRADPGNTNIDINLRDVIYCNGIRFGRTTDWEFVLEQLKMTSSSSQQSDLRDALACTREPWLLQRLMDMSLDSMIIRKQDVRSVLQAVSANPIGRDMAWSFLKQHFDNLTKFMTPSNFGSMVLTLTEHFNQQHQLNEIRRFMAEQDVSIAEASFLQVMERTSLNMEWLENYYTLISQFLEERTKRSE